MYTHIHTHTFHCFYSPTKPKRAPGMSKLANNDKKWAMVAPEHLCGAPSFEVATFEVA